MIEEILDQCLKDISAKRATLADCLKKYPQYADELAPLLETALALKAMPDVQPSRAFKLKTRARLTQLSRPALPRRFTFLVPRFSLATLATIILVALGLTGGMVYAASDSLPDSPLYSIKRGTEEIQVLLATDPESQARVHMGLAEQRLLEAQALAGRASPSAFAEQTVAEYSRQVNASLAAVPSEQPSSTSLSQELMNRLTRQQDELRTLEKMVSAPALEKALNASEKAKEKLDTLMTPKPTNAPPVSAPTSTILAPTRIPVTPTLVPAATYTLPPTAMPMLTPALSLPPLTLPGATLSVPTLAPGPPSGAPPLPKPTLHGPPENLPTVPGIPVPHAP